MFQSLKTPPVVLFDLDGTLIHSAPDLRVAVNKCLMEDGRRPISDAETMQMVGNGVHVLMERAYAATGQALTDAAESELLVERFLVFYAEAPTDRTRPYEGVVETLDALRDAGCTLAVVTNKPHAPTVEILRLMKLDHYFRVVIGGGSTPHLKPHPQPLLTALERLGASPEQAIMVGDSPNDSEAARAAGVPVVCVTFGYRRCSAEDLGADALIDHFADLPKAIQQVLGVAGQLGC